MGYTTVYEVTSEASVPDLLPIIIGLALILFSLLFFLHPRVKASTIMKCFGLAWLTLATLLTAVISGLSIYDKWELNKAYRGGRFTVVEGRVENFVPISPGGKGTETFTVDGVRFQYSDNEITGAYNKTLSHGGEIAPDRTVRLSYVENRRIKRNLIVKVEVSPKTDGD